MTKDEPRERIKLRLATPDDVPVLESWDKKQHVIAASGEDDSYDWKAEIRRSTDWQEILIAEADKRPIGVIVVIDPQLEESHYWGDVGPNLRALDIWIGEETDLGKGYGTKMMIQAVDRCFKNAEVEAILVDPLASNTDAIRFYEKLGFRRVGQRTFGNDNCYVYKLERDNQEVISNR